MKCSLAISPQEKMALVQEDLERFWFSRLQKRDPVARIGYALWVSDPNKLKKEIITGDPEYWNHKPFVYWEAMARSTVVNLAMGLERAGFHGTFMEMRQKIKEVGIVVARYHVRFTENDYRHEFGSVPGLLSLKQMADYHHAAFKNFNISPTP